MLPKPSYIHPIPLPPPLTTSLPTPLTTLASTIHHSLTSNTQIPRPSSHLSTPLTPSSAYTVSSLVSSLRNTSTNSSTPIGRKIGFTNTNIWNEYNVTGPNWGYIWDSTIFDLSAFPPAPPPQSTSNDAEVPRCDLSAMNRLQPRLEPELVLGVRRDAEVRGTMTDAEMLACVEWMAPGFEIVVSPYKDWVFDGPETTCCGALHGLLLVGTRVMIDARRESGVEGWLRQLEEFTVGLGRDGDAIDEGFGKNVLGSPIRALRFLVEVLEDQGTRLNGGEVVTTGTLTRAWPIADGEVWEMRVGGLDGVDGVRCRFVM